MKKALLSKPGEWADKVGDKLGGLLPSKKNKAPLPRKNSAPNLVNYGADADADVRLGGQGWDASDNENSGRGSPDPPGPDTSSLSAFLMNLLSSEKGEKEEKGTLGFGWGGSRPGVVASRSGDQTPDRSRGRGEQCVSGEVHEEGNTQRGEFYDVDWLLVDEHVKVSNPVSIPPKPQKKQLPSISSDRLPRMSDDSSLLSDDVRCCIHPALPTLAKGRRWVLLYSTEKHGMSLLTLYRNSNMMTGPLLLVAGDKEGAVFGGLITAPLVPSPKKKYQGTSDSFVFSNVTGEPTIFHPTGANRYYVLATTDALALGGGSHFALHVDAELLNGSSGVCETYDSPCLAHSEEFILKHVELWGFDHTQRHSSFSEPSPLMTW
ncbi:hypothetical protein M758_3G062800 [Ceratodon purpureus]|uniref:Oxidation resistance protein 1 n=1 Tax=Ceratodon purpureus TaxID=3225 RepID=A0A8T0IHU1_CERPU|nr:hypothetical protein KC19_3G063600 [Ceratodon purpureus]KAG0621973.1 hypothetical protein M758_3G062800 [Ceratodon purpureus]KAG0621974.1 hypothetical protein M758_3G062800 [Ceratodon purpureus]